MDVFSLVALLRVAACFIIAWLPGIAIYSGASRLSGDMRAGFPQALLFGVGLSIAFWPLLLLYLTLLGLSLGAVGVWTILAASAGLLIYLWLPVRGELRLSRDQAFAALGLAAMDIFAFIVRLLDINGLPVPMFGDSLHHTMIATIIATTGRVPSGYQPFVPVDTFTYHFGFHTLAALISDITGATPSDAVLLMGQVLITVAIPVAYLMAQMLFESRVAALFAAALTGFVSAMPAYYVNWGRYTQLAGQVLLPVALGLLWLAIQPLPGTQRRLKAARWALAAFCVAGLVVVHYRILIFYGLFGLALALWQLLTGWRDLRSLIRLWLFELSIVLAGLLASATWLGNLLANYIPGLVGRLSTVSTEYIAAYNSLDNFRHFVGAAMLSFGLLGLVLALYSIFLRRGQGTKSNPNQSGHLSATFASLVVATWALLMLLSILWPPGAIGSYTVAISLYIPLTALGGYGLAQLLALLPVKPLQEVWAAPVLAFAASILSAFALGTWHLSDPGQFSYVHPADLQAFSWIRDNTPAGSKFLISSEFSYAGRGVTASDAGMWLPLLAGRNVSVPALSSWTEHPIQPDFFSNTRKLAALTQPPTDPNVEQLASTGAILTPRDLGDPQTLSVMQKLGITYIYSGTRGGASKPRLDVAALRRESCRFKLVYTEGSVYVFQILYDATGCSG